MKPPRPAFRLGLGLALGAGGLALYYALVRGRVLTWGATAEEAVARLPGDELLEDADGVATRAIEIDAPASAVWPWIAQMGPAPRGGAYTYDWIENLLGLNMHSVDRVLPDLQHPQIGETISYGKNRMRIGRLEPERVLAWRSEDGKWVWTFVLAPTARGTRLISRTAFACRASSTESGWPRWNQRRCSWRERCCSASNGAPSGSPRRTRAVARRELVPPARPAPAGRSRGPRGLRSRAPVLARPSR
jgi:hypothetical protein